MVNQSQTLQDHIAVCINAAYSVLNHPLETISRLFEGRDICILNHPFPDSKNQLVEISFNHITISCKLNDEKICKSSFLFPDNPFDLAHYLDFCNRIYRFDDLFQAWIIKDGYIQSIKDDNMYYLVIRPFHNISVCHG